jgi:hypothetical protein
MQQAAATLALIPTILRFTVADGAEQYDGAA